MTRKTIGLVAHDDKKDDIVAFALRHKDRLAQFDLVGTGTTSGRVAEGRLDALIFFIDPLSALPHDVDVKALTRLATLYDIPLANNKSTAEAVLRAL